MEVYYQDQSNWGQSQYYSLWRYLNRFFLRASANMEEIKNIKLNSCSEITKVMMYCFIKTQHKEDLLELENLKELAGVRPLEETLEIITPPTNSNKVFAEYNILF